MLDNKVIVITGATGGLGEPISRHISSLGASVVLVDVNAKKLDSIGKDLNCFTYVLDLLCEEDIKNFVKNIQQKYVNIDNVDLSHISWLLTDLTDNKIAKNIFS